MSVLQQTVSLAAQLRASSSLSSSSRTSRQLQESPPQARYRLKPMSLMIDRFLLSRLESLYESFKSSEGGQRRDCVICSVPLSLHSANPTDSPDARIIVGALVVLSDGLCLWRKDPHLPYQGCPSATCRARTGLPPMAFSVSFRIRFAEAKTDGKHHRPTHIRPLGPHHKCTLISRPTAVYHGYIYIESVRRYSCHFTALLPMCIRLT